METISTYYNLEYYVESVDKGNFENLYRPIVKFPRNCNIDKVALHSLPKDCPRDYFPIVHTGDAKCLSRL